MLGRKIFEKTFLPVFLAAGIFSSSLVNARGQEEVKEISPMDLPEVELSSVFEGDNLYNKVIEPYKEEIEKKEEPKNKDMMANVLFFYPEKKPLPFRGNISFLDLYVFNLQKTLNEDRFYYLSHDYEKGDFPFEESFWDALGVTLIQKYAFIRKIDRTVRKAQNMVTVKYKSSSGFSFRAQPFIESIGEEEEYGVKASLKHKLGGVYTKIKPESFKTGVESSTLFGKKFALEYSLSKRDEGNEWGEEDKKNEETIRAYLYGIF
jgi:hypothetical protein